jgi:threonine dehydrogenase-like Zn-dependent dehydrogenase
MKTHDVLSAVQQLASVMARAEETLGPERFALAQRDALTAAVGGVAPLGLSAAQMARVAGHLDIEVLLNQLTQRNVATAKAAA